MDTSASDQTLQQRVLEELAWNPALRDADVVADVRDGVVVLRGQLRDLAQRTTARAAVERVAGVTRVIDTTTTAFAGDDQDHDSEVRASVEKLIVGTAIAPRHPIQVDVQEGVVTLTGTLEWDFQRETIIELVSGLRGVREVVSRLQLTPRPSGEDAAARIRRAFVGSASVDADGVRVHVTGTTATLTGTVRSSAERVEAERATWASPHVTSVRNELTVTPV